MSSLPDSVNTRIKQLELELESVKKDNQVTKKKVRSLVKKLRQHNATGNKKRRLTKGGALIGTVFPGIGLNDLGKVLQFMSTREQFTMRSVSRKMRRAVQSLWGALPVLSLTISRALMRAPWRMDRVRALDLRGCEEFLSDSSALAMLPCMPNLTSISGCAFDATLLASKAFEGVVMSSVKKMGCLKLVTTEDANCPNCWAHDLQLMMSYCDMDSLVRTFPSLEVLHVLLPCSVDVDHEEPMNECIDEFVNALKKWPKLKSLMMDDMQIDYMLEDSEFMDVDLQPIRDVCAEQNIEIT
eukprot:138834_1